MKTKMIWGIVTALAVAFCFVATGFAKEITITGEVNDEYQIVTSDGKIYEVAETEKGNELVSQHIGEKVSVTGTVQKMEEEELEVIVVSNYTVINNE